MKNIIKQIFPNLRLTLIYLLWWACHACLLQGSLCLLPCRSFSVICHKLKLALAGRQSRMALAKRRCAPPQFYSEIYGIVFSIIVTSVTAMMTILQQLTLFSSALVIGIAICCNVYLKCFISTASSLKYPLICVHPPSIFRPIHY